MNGIDRRALLRGLVSLPAIIPAAALPAAASEALRPEMTGLGMIFIDGRPVYFDTLDYQDIPAGTPALVIGPGYRGRPVVVRETVDYDHFTTRGPRPRHVLINAPQGRANYECVSEVPIIGRVLSSWEEAL